MGRKKHTKLTNEHSPISFYNTCDSQFNLMKWTHSLKWIALGDMVCILPSRTTHNPLLLPGMSAPFQWQWVHVLHHFLLLAIINGHCKHNNQVLSFIP
jgi:hypothetical protein